VSMFDIFTWTITVISITGVVFNIRQDRRCFLCWIASNTSWAVIDYQKGLFAQAFLFFVYLILSVWGLWEWRHKEKG
jgi:nicotinamide riboside transporter PnuC